MSLLFTTPPHTTLFHPPARGCIPLGLVKKTAEAKVKSRTLSHWIHQGKTGPDRICRSLLRANALKGERKVGSLPGSRFVTIRINGATQLINLRR